MFYRYVVGVFTDKEWRDTSSGPVSNSVRSKPRISHQVVPVYSRQLTTGKEAVISLLCLIPGI